MDSRELCGEGGERWSSVTSSATMGASSVPLVLGTIGTQQRVLKGGITVGCGGAHL